MTAAREQDRERRVLEGIVRAGGRSRRALSEAAENAGRAQVKRSLGLQDCDSDRQ